MQSQDDYKLTRARPNFMRDDQPPHLQLPYMYPAPSLHPYPPAAAPWPTHRTSNSREELLDSPVHDSARARLSDYRDLITSTPGMPLDASKDFDDNLSAASEFVKKLYRMLEDNAYPNVVSWTPNGESFVVKDMTEFTKTVLPRMFKHSNFASFVRQLNKYDFHKIKTGDESKFGEQTWTFRHPDFQSKRKDALENIKRKVPATRKTTSAARMLPTYSTPESPIAQLTESSVIHSMQQRMEQMGHSQDEMRSVIATLETNYQAILNELVGIQRTVAQQDNLIRSLVEHVVASGNSQAHDGTDAVSALAEQMRDLAKSYPRGDLSPSTMEQMNKLAQRAALMRRPPTSFSQGDTLPLPEHSTHAVGGGYSLGIVADPTAATVPDGTAHSPQVVHRQASTAAFTTQSNQPPSSLSEYREQEMQVFTVGHLVPRGTNISTPDGTGVAARDSSNQGDTNEWGFSIPAQPQHTDAAVRTPPGIHASPATPAASVDRHIRAENGTSSKLRVRRGTYVPRWTVTPRVLLVDDDAVSRTLSSKLLQVAGCNYDVAVDGEVAVDKMNLEKYDLVLMDIVMPKLDGVSATSRIRQFDLRTPIISMTSNSKPNEVMNYYNHGMNDILSKPFTKDNLVNILEKHLTHLTAIRHLNRLPSSVGPPPMNHANFDMALATDFSISLAGDSGRNPLAGMGVSDAQYSLMLQKLVNNGQSAGTFGEASTSKRPFEDEDDRDSKRSRFEVVE